MQLTQTLTNRTQSKRSKDLLYYSCKLNSTSQDIIQLFLSQITDEDTELNQYTVKIADIESKLEKRLNPIVLSKIEEELFKPVFEYKNGANTDKYAWCSKISRNDIDRTLTIEIHKELKEHLIGLKNRKVSFTVIDSNVFFKLKSAYSKRFYTIFKYWAGYAIDYKNETTGYTTFKVEELVELLRLSKSMSEYKNLKARVLNVAVEEINKYSDLEIKMIEGKKSEKQKTKVEEVGFLINYKKEVLIEKRAAEKVKNGVTLENFANTNLSDYNNEEIIEAEIA
ncbi:replication initiation protein [Aliarcobacter butzleri]|uniref:replication initiation protein n=1 Tax=Aliarcobacter butzleri TaxID=28197 RepID=UPI00344D990F